MREVRAGTQTHALLVHLASVYPRSATIEQLIDEMWGHARLPETPYWNVRSIVKDARRKIRPYGWTIPHAGRGREIGLYRLARIDAEEM